MFKVYKIQHKKTGYYYQPIKSKIGEETRTNLGPNGKVYTSEPRLDKLINRYNISESICKKFDIEWRENFKYNENDFEVIIYECRRI